MFTKMSVLCPKRTEKENVSCLLRLRFLRYRQTPNNLKRVKAHALGREPSTLLLVVSLIWRISESKNQSGRFNVYVQLFYLSP